MQEEFDKDLLQNEETPAPEADRGVPFINTSISKTERVKSPHEKDETSVIGDMTDPEADDDVDDFGDPFGGD